LHGTGLSPLLRGPGVSLLLHRPGLSLLLLGPNLCSGILHDLCPDILCGLRLGILYGLYGPDLRPGIFIGRPSLEFIQQVFGWWLTDFGRTLVVGLKGGSNFDAGRRLTCSRRQSLSAGG
jgi:hypothetical protein